MKRSLLLSFALLLATLTFAQTQMIGKLRQQIAHTPDATSKLRLYMKLWEQHESIHRDSLWTYYHDMEAVLAKNNDRQARASAEIALINILLRLDQADSAFKRMSNNLAMIDPKEQSSRWYYFRLNGLKAAYFGERADYESATETLLKTITEAEVSNDSLVLARNMNSLGVIDYNRNNLPAALSWEYKGLSYCNSNPKYDDVRSSLYINIASTYAWVEKNDSAQYFLDLAIPLCEKTENLFYLANAWLVQANLYKWTKRLPQAETAMLKAMDLRKQTEGDLAFSNEQLALANFYYTKEEYDNAISIYQVGIQKVKSIEKDAAHHNINYDVLVNYYIGLSKCYQATGQSGLYAQALEDLVKTKDILYETNSAKAIAQLQTQYDVQKKENTIMQQRFDLTQKNYFIYGAAGLLVFAFLLAIILFYNYKKRQALKLQMILQEEKSNAQLEVARAEEKERKRIAADLHDNLGSYAASVVSNLDFIEADEQAGGNKQARKALRQNAMSIVSQLSDTIWVLNKDALSLTNISDRLKVFIRRVEPSFPSMQIGLVEDITTDIMLPASQAYHLFRITQEAVNNALRHSGGRHVDIKLESDEQWKVEINDDGKGMQVNARNEPREGGNGLLNMQNRAEEAGWTIHWETNEEGGTRVVIRPVQSSTSN